MKDPAIAAIFDVDGTLISGRSLEGRFYRFLLRIGEVGPMDFAKYLGGVAAGVSFRVNKRHLRGKDESRLRMLAQRCFEHEIKPDLLPATIDRARLHQISGHEIALVSGTLDLLLEPLAEYLGVRCARGTRLEASGGVLTGDVSGVHPYAEGKVEALGELQSLYGFDLARSFAYANHSTDRYLLSVVGHPVATNPDRRLRRLAQLRGWMIEDFTSCALPDGRGWIREEAH
jgi:HAD superfamily hydrolase (TIGR01490 family)